MARARTKAAPKAPAIRRGKQEIVKVALRHEGLSEASLLDLTNKTDSADASRSHVHQGQFSDSFMMATNGGATYEDLLRPAARSAAAVAAAAAAASPSTEPSRPRHRRRWRHNGLHNVIGDSDDRVLITDTTRIPSCSVAQLRIQTGIGEPRCGTAWLIGPRTLATAAHNLLSRETHETISIMAGLGFDGHKAQGGWHKVVDNAFRQAWRDDPSSDNVNDYAVLKIADPAVGNRFGWFGYANYEDAKFPSMILNIFGYPVDVDHPGYMYASAGRIIRTTSTRLFYDCDAGGGMSGGPVIARFGDKRIAVGIHVAGGDSSNVATRITASAYSLFEEHKNW